MKKIFVFLSTFLMVFISASSVLSEQYWAKTYGGSGDDIVYSMQPTQDGGSIVAGSTNSFGTDFDFWVLKLDSAGSISWEKKFGESSYRKARIIQQTSDGGYIVLGCYDCNLGYGDNTWLLKLTGDGDISWQKIFPNILMAVQQTLDGGYVLAGKYNFPGNRDGDFCVLKLDGNGNIIWQKAYGDGYPYAETANAIQQTTDGGYIVAGYIFLLGCSNCGRSRVLKLDDNGEVTWENVYDGLNPHVNSIQQTEDGGYIMAGERGDSSTNYDFWIVKLDATGTITWQKAYGGSDDETAYSVRLTPDGGYIISGCYNCWFTADDREILFMKIDSNGDIIGQKLCEDCNTFSLHQRIGGGFITAGVKLDSTGLLDVVVFNLDSNWEIPNCPVMEETTLPASDSGEIIRPLPMETQSIAEPLTDTTIIPQDTSAETTVACCYDMEDNDLDCVQQEEDNCPFITNPNQEDTDEDSLGDVCDNCPDHYNPNQEDTDTDDIGDACDLCPNDPDNDADSDNVCGDIDNCPNTPNPLQEDTYPPGGNGLGDACDCEGNFNCSEDDDCDGSNAADFKADFGRSSFNRPCTDEDPCNGDFLCRGQVDGSDAALFKSDFGRSSFSNPCPMSEAVVEWCVYE